MYPVRDFKSKLWGYWSNGAWQVSPRFCYASSFRNSIANVVTKNGEALLISGGDCISLESIVGEAALARGFSSVDGRNASTCLVHSLDGHRWWLIDTAFEAKLISFPTKQVFKRVDKLGDILILWIDPTPFSGAYFFDWNRSLFLDVPIFGTNVGTDRLWAVSTRPDLSLWQFFDITAFEFVGPAYPKANGFGNELASVKVDDQWHVIGLDFEPVFNVSFESATQFCNGYAVVANVDDIGYLSKDGDFSPFKNYVDLDQVNEYGMAIAKRTYSDRSLDIVRPKGDVLATGYDSACYLQCDFPYFDLEQGKSQILLDHNLAEIYRTGGC